MINAAVHLKVHGSRTPNKLVRSILLRPDYVVITMAD